ncbi:porin family protein [Dokdonella sp.]|uniref:outer membrane protein n=1 Tax=Dokdonella sp. TaxID=2291710 RepID=UPI0025C3F4BC|nr:porin family protein [Dokdonella sp.]MBX3688652.1 porin family protein [Dokdonella sp.]
MKNMLLATALASALFAIPAAHAANDSGFFLNAQVGQAALDRNGYDGDDTGYALNGGYRWALAPNFLLGVEGGYTHLGSFDPKGAIPAIGSAELKGWTVGANAHFNMTDNWYLSGRAGYFRSDLKGGYVTSFDPATNVYGVSHIDDTSSKWYAGVGFGYDFNNNFSIGLNYDYYKADKNGLDLNPRLVSVSGEYRF